MVPARSPGARARAAGHRRPQDGAVRRPGGEPGLPHRPARPAPQGHRRVRQHDLHRLRGQRRRGDRPLRDDRRHARHARLPLRRDEMVPDRPEGLGRPGLVRRLRRTVGAGLDDALQPVQGLPRRGRDQERPHRQRSRGQARPR